jgi:hypothetical protein
MGLRGAKPALLHGQGIQPMREVMLGVARKRYSLNRFALGKENSHRKSRLR